MFFANGYVENDRRVSATCASDESDILRELLMEGELASPNHFTSSSAKSHSFPSKRSHMEITIPPISFDSSQFQRLQPPLSIRGSSVLLPTPGGQGSSSSFFPSSSDPSPPRSSSTSHSFFQSSSSSSGPTSNVINAIISPPRVFIQEFARLPPPFFNDPVHSTLDTELMDARQSKHLPAMQLSSFSQPPPPPVLTMPPLKKKKVQTNTSERKQLRCSYPNCPNLRRSAGFCNRHSGKICSIPDCNKSALSRGKCPEHGGGSRCKREGCSKFAQTRGLCKSHGGGRQCNVAGCTKNAHQNRLCRSHGGGKRCDYYGCPKWAQRSGYCCAHTKMGTHGSGTSSHTSSPAPSNVSMGTPPSTSASPQRLTPFSLLS